MAILIEDDSDDIRLGALCQSSASKRQPAEGFGGYAYRRHHSVHAEAGKQDFFQFDDGKNMFPPALKTLLRDAWKWMDMKRAKIDDDDDWGWFVDNFGKLFRKQVSKATQAAEAQLRDEEAKRYKTTKPNQANASSFAGAGTRTM